jgi:hypothetical protein
MYAKTFSIIGALASVATAHIKMSAPVPYGASSLNNSPLDPSGSDFPCKQRPGVYEVEGATNTYSLGSTGNNLAFIGSAVHGGGSCQVSITYDAKPDKNSVWKVIKSIEGGCPAQDTPGNLGDNAALEVPYKYDFDIPSDIPAGSGTIAWTWFNKVGNREMYMNCAPVTLEGSGGSQSAFEALPDMFVANIGTGCGTEEGTDVQFPNAGSNVEQRNGATTAFGAPTGSCQAAGGNGGNAPAPTAAPAPTSAPAPTPTGGAGNGDAEEISTPPLGGIFIPVPTTESAVAEPTATVPVPDQGNEQGNDGAAPTPIPSPPAEDPEEQLITPPTGGDGSNQGSPNTGAGAQQVGSPCTNEGEWNCVGGTSFQRCASGSWSSVMQLAGGTSCTPGLGSSISMVVTRNGRTRPLRFRSA